MNKLLTRTKLNGSYNIITGCGSGLGRATLQWFLTHGSGPLLGIDRSFDQDFEDNLGLNEEQKSNLMLRKHETFDEKESEASISDFVAKHGKIDNLVNVAGVSAAFQLYNNKGSVYDLKHAHHLVNFNTVGTFNIIRLAARYMMKENASTNPQSTKCIINTSCISTTEPSIGQTFYAASKAALDSMTLCIARELSPFNIRCNTINVGFFDTKLLRSTDDRLLVYLGLNSLAPGRIGQPEEFAHLVQSIIENQMINGACIKIDAGSKAPHP